MEYLSGLAASERAEGSLGTVPALKSAGQVSKDGIIGTAGAPIHMVTAETGQFKDQLWRTFRSIALTFLLISGIGALIEDRGISKGFCFFKDLNDQFPKSILDFVPVKIIDKFL